MLNPDRPLDRFREPLRFIPADDRDVYIKVGMALHHESGGSDEALDMWREWAQRSDKFRERDLLADWRSFRSKPGGVKGGTIIQLARQHGYRNGYRNGGINGRRAPKPVQERAPTPWETVEDELKADGYTVEAVYEYVDENGKAVGEKVRLKTPPGHRKPKEFRWRSVRDGMLVAAKPDAPTPPYGLHRMLEHADQPVWVPEGEKDADRLNKLGLVAVSIEAGHESTAAEYLKGATIFVVPDQDVAGEKRATKVIGALRKVGGEARIIRLPQMHEGADVSDFLDAGHTVSDLVRLTEAEAVEAAADDLAGVFEMWGAMEFDPDDEYLIDQILPRRGTGLLYAPSTAGKTFLSIDLAASVCRGIPFAHRYEVEQPGPVVYLAVESARSVKKRLVAYKQKHAINGGELALMNFKLNLGDDGRVKTFIELLKGFEASR
jgi:hypothetical protein